MNEPQTSKNKVLKSFTQMLTGSGIRTIASIVSGYFFALFLGPAVYGIWQTVRVFLSYGTFVSLGIPFVMRRDFITLRAEGKQKEAVNMAQVTMTYSFIVNPIIAVVLFAIALFSYSEAAFKISLIVVGLLYVTQLFSGIGNILHKGYNDYKTLAIGDIIYGIGLLLIIPLVYYKGYYALLTGYLIVSIVKSTFFYIKRPLPYKWRWNLPLLKKMVYTAFPIFLVTITSTVFASVDRLLIAGMLDFANVGLYSLSSFIAQPVTLLVSSFSIVLFTQLNERYGKSKEPHVISKHVFYPQRVFSNFLPTIMGVGIISLPLLTKMFLPQYEGGVLAAQINIFAILFIKMAGFASNALFVLDKQKFTALSFFIAGSLKTAGSYAALKAGYGIEGVAICTLVAYFIYNSLMLYFISKNLGEGFVAFMQRLLQGVLSPLVILIFCSLFFVFGKGLFDRIGIISLWLHTIIGLGLIGLVGTPFLLKAISTVKALYK